MAARAGRVHAVKAGRKARAVMAGRGASSARVKAVFSGPSLRRLRNVGSRSPPETNCRRRPRVWGMSDERVGLQKSVRPYTS
jgi:hypothetical protein